MKVGGLTHESIVRACYLTYIKPKSVPIFRWQKSVKTISNLFLIILLTIFFRLLIVFMKIDIVFGASICKLFVSG